VLLVPRLAEAAGGRPVEWTRSAYRGDRFRFIARTLTPVRE
jgi:GntR family transcriptional regulator